MATEYNIARTQGQCCRCRGELTPNEEFVAVLTEAGEQFERHDWCVACWEAPDRGAVENLFSTWRSRVPVREKKKKLFVDDGLLVTFFERLAGADEPAKLNFRFVLTLVLMRKRLLNYEGSTKGADGREVWTLRLRHKDAAAETHQVVNPRLDETQIAEVGEQLSQILQGEL